MRRIDLDQRPDLVGLFPPRDIDGGWRLIPRTAAVLHDALSLLADWADDDADDLGDDPSPAVATRSCSAGCLG